MAKTKAEEASVTVKLEHLKPGCRGVFVVEYQTMEGSGDQKKKVDRNHCPACGAWVSTPAIDVKDEEFDE